MSTTGNAKAIIAAIVGLLLIWGLLVIDWTVDLPAYVAMTLCAFLPTYLWLQVGASGIPVFPVAASLYYLYFALPVLRNNIGARDATEIEYLSIAVCGFLLAATLSSQILIVGARRRTDRALPGHLAFPLTRLMFVGLAIGLLFQLAYITQILGFLGSLIGVVRAIALTATSAACFILGHARAQGVLRGSEWRLAIMMLFAILTTALANLFLVLPLVYCSAALLGFIITKKEIPWKLVIGIFVIAVVLHSGKGEMRAKYWYKNTNFGEAVSIFELPGMLVEWTYAGLASIVSGKSEREQNVIDRASLAQLLIGVVRATPESVPYLSGETYALVTQTLIPRFLDNNKLNSQAGMQLLNIRYGRQTAEQADVTAIGWGLIAEAYANFGFLGTVGVGFVFGALTTLFTRLSASAPIMSLRNFLAIVAMINFMNPEFDATYLLTNLFQSLIAAIVFFKLSVPLSVRTENRAMQRAVAPKRPFG